MPEIFQNADFDIQRSCRLTKNRVSVCCVLENEATIMPTSEAPYPSGKGAVCKTAMQRFEPARRLHTNLLLTYWLFIALSSLSLVGRRLQCSHSRTIYLLG